jgi:hypothetical protein
MSFYFFSTWSWCGSAVRRPPMSSFKHSTDFHTTHSSQKTPAHLSTSQKLKPGKTKVKHCFLSWRQKSPRHSKIVFGKLLKRKQVFWYIVCNLFCDLILISSFFQQRVRILPAFQSHWTTCLQHLSWEWVQLNTN